MRDERKRPIPSRPIHPYPSPPYLAGDGWVSLLIVKVFLNIDESVDEDREPVYMSLSHVV